MWRKYDIHIYKLVIVVFRMVYPKMGYILSWVDHTEDNYD
jgi:hypothetical protein